MSDEAMVSEAPVDGMRPDERRVLSERAAHLDTPDTETLSLAEAVADIESNG
jgi:hypothetical protein